MLGRIEEKFTDIGASSLMDLGNTCLIEHEVNTGNAKPIKQSMRRVPFAMKEEFNKLVDEMLNAGLIVESESPWCSPTVLVKKKDGSMRICVDYRRVNEVTVKDSYPIPKIEEILNQLGGNTVFTTLDLASGYHQVSVKKEDRGKTAFCTDRGLFEYVVMPFGLTNAPATFQRLMERVLKGLIGKICLVYLDDVMIYSKSLAEHEEHLNMVLERIKRSGLKIKFKKCSWVMKEVEYLGHVVCREGIKPSPKKIEAIMNAKLPKTLKQLQSFLGLATYYRRFIKDFSKVASPLYKATEKSKKFELNEDCVRAFETLRSILTSDDVLILPDFGKEFYLETDASNYGLGGVLSQYKDTVRRPIAYWSKHLSKPERNYSTIEKEAFAVVLAVEYFKQYVYGRTFKVLVDHQPLKWLMSMVEPAPRLARWILRLRVYDFIVEYRSGKSNGNADALSRWAIEEEEELKAEEENKEELDIDTVVVNAIHLGQLEPVQESKDQDLEWLIGLKKANSNLKPVLHEFENNDRRNLFQMWDKLVVNEGNLYREWINDYGEAEYR